jgi:SAM-dependent methyltransferase
MNESHLRYLSSPEWAHTLATELLPWIRDVGDLGDEVLEIGPGPGLTTDLLRSRVRSLTAVEVDADLAEELAVRLAGTNVTVLHADAAHTKLPSSHFSAAVCFSALHHIPSQVHQDLVFGAVGRLLRPGGIFLGIDSLDIDLIRQAHADDTFVPVDSETLGARFARVGLIDTHVEHTEYQFRFFARKPASESA